jgi:hypothetical protein
MTRHIYNPEGFDPKLYLPQRLWKHADSARYLLHAIEANRVFYHRTRNQYNPLKAAYLNAVMGRWCAKDIRDALAEAGVVERIPSYVPGVESKKYRLGPDLRGALFRRYPVPPQLAKRLKKHKMFVKPKLAVHKHLYRWLKRVEVDYDEAVQSFQTREEQIDKLVTLDMLVDKAFFFTTDEYGRVHTNISCLSRSLRRFLRFGTERLVHLDICNSQPFFFSLLLLNYFSNGKSVNSFYSSPTREGGRRRGGQDRSITIDILSNLRRRMALHDDLPKDVKEYIALTEKGLLYEELVNLFGVGSREKAKVTFFASILFCKPLPNKYRTIFRSRFPSIDEAISDLKRNDHRRLAHHLQRCESAVMIHGVCERLRHECPEAPILTIHDSILTTKPYLELVRTVLRDELNAISLCPTFKEQDFTLAA